MAYNLMLYNAALGKFEVRDYTANNQMTTDTARLMRNVKVGDVCKDLLGTDVPQQGLYLPANQRLVVIDLNLLFGAPVDPAGNTGPTVVHTSYEAAKNWAVTKERQIFTNQGINISEDKYDEIMASIKDFFWDCGSKPHNAGMHELADRANVNDPHTSPIHTPNISSNYTVTNRELYIVGLSQDDAGNANGIVHDDTGGIVNNANLQYTRYQVCGVNLMDNALATLMEIFATSENSKKNQYFCYNINDPFDTVVVPHVAWVPGPVGPYKNAIYKKILSKEMGDTGQVLALCKCIGEDYPDGFNSFNDGHGVRLSKDIILLTCDGGSLFSSIQARVPCLCNISNTKIFCYNPRAKVYTTAETRVVLNQHYNNSMGRIDFLIDTIRSILPTLVIPVAGSINTVAFTTSDGKNYNITTAQERKFYRTVFFKMLTYLKNLKFSLENNYRAIDNFSLIIDELQHFRLFLQSPAAGLTPVQIAAVNDAIDSDAGNLSNIISNTYGFNVLFNAYEGSLSLVNNNNYLDPKFRLLGSKPWPTKDSYFTTCAALTIDLNIRMVLPGTPPAPGAVGAAPGAILQALWTNNNVSAICNVIRPLLYEEMNNYNRLSGSYMQVYNNTAFIFASSNDTVRLIRDYMAEELDGGTNEDEYDIYRDLLRAPLTSPGYRYNAPDEGDEYDPAAPVMFVGGKMKIFKNHKNKKFTRRKNKKTKKIFLKGGGKRTTKGAPITPQSKPQRSKPLQNTVRRERNHAVKVNGKHRHLELLKQLAKNQKNRITKQEEERARVYLAKKRRRAAAAGKAAMLVELTRELDEEWTRLKEPELMERMVRSDAYNFCLKYTGISLVGEGLALLSIKFAQYEVIVYKKDTDLYSLLAFYNYYYFLCKIYGDADYKDSTDYTRSFLMEHASEIDYPVYNSDGGEELPLIIKFPERGVEIEIHRYTKEEILAISMEEYDAIVENVLLYLPNELSYNITIHKHVLSIWWLGHVRLPSFGNKEDMMRSFNFMLKNYQLGFVRPSHIYACKVLLQIVDEGDLQAVAQGPEGYVQLSFFINSNNFYIILDLMEFYEGHVIDMTDDDFLPSFVEIYNSYLVHLTNPTVEEVPDEDM